MRRKRDEDPNQNVQMYNRKQSSVLIRAVRYGLKIKFVILSLLVDKAFKMILQGVV